MENTNIVKKTNKYGFKSMPAQSGWWKFFTNAFFTRNYFNYEGRASRKEFWAVNTLISLIFLVISVLVAMISYTNTMDLYEIRYLLMGINFINYYTYLPLASLSIRRFHDINMSAWWGVLIIPLFFLPFFKGDKKDNKYGENIYPVTEE